MQMSDVMGRPVVDPSGKGVGKVSDVRLVQDGPYIEGFGNSLRLDAVVVGRAGIASRLGYVRGGVRGPWLLRLLAAAIERRAYLISWTDLHETDTGFTTSHSRADLPRLGDAYGGSPVR